MTTYELLQYYQNLLILQYKGKPKAVGSIAATVSPILMAQMSIQTITLSAAADSGSYILSYGSNNTDPISYSDSLSVIQSTLRLISGLESIVVDVSTEVAQQFLIYFIDVVPPALGLEVLSNSLMDADGNPVTITVGENDLTLPLAVQNAFNLLGDDTAVGVQLDILGKYTGVTRNGYGFQGQPISLVDADFLQLIKMATVTNNSDASLQTIQNLLNRFFPNQVLVTDYKNMKLSYLISSTVGSLDLIQLFVTERLLPKPMGVQISVSIVPDVTILFAFRTYQLTMPNGKPFNRYGSFNTDWRWLSYADNI